MTIKTMTTSLRLKKVFLWFALATLVSAMDGAPEEQMPESLSSDESVDLLREKKAYAAFLRGKEKFEQYFRYLARCEGKFSI